MQIHLLSSQSSVPSEGDRTQHPAHLPGDLSAALRGHGHQVEVRLLGDALGGRELATLSEGAAVGRKLDPGTASVLHALDPPAWAAALTARSQSDVVVVLRYAESTAAAEPAHRACLRSADAVAAPADTDRQAALRAGVKGQRALLVPDLVRVLTEKPSPAALNPGRVLVSLSGIGPGSGVETALEALRWLPNRELVIAGRGGDTDVRALQGRLRLLGLQDRVRWLGWLDRPEAIGLIDSAALVICPGSTAGATAAVEAMARSRAVAVVAGGRAAEVVVDGVTGSILPGGKPIDFASGLRALLKNPFQLEAMGLAGRERALTLFAPERAVSATEEAYRIALGAA